MTLKILQVLTNDSSFNNYLLSTLILPLKNSFLETTSTNVKNVRIGMMSFHLTKL